jgi:hypothetical protein
MRRAPHDGKTAEAILSLATTPDRAATTAGDLLEEADTRGLTSPRPSRTAN